MERERWPEFKDLFLFQLLTDEEGADAISIFQEKSFTPGQAIFYEEDRGETMHVILTGSVKITKRDGEELKELITLSPGDFFGEITLFEYALRTAGAVAEEDTTTIEVDRTSFNKLFSFEARTLSLISHLIKRLPSSRKLTCVESSDLRSSFVIEKSKDSYFFQLLLDDIHMSA